MVAKGFLEAQVQQLRAWVSAGYSRGRFDVRRDRKPWYDLSVEATYYVAPPFVVADCRRSHQTQKF